MGFWTNLWGGGKKTTKARHRTELSDKPPDGVLKEEIATDNTRTGGVRTIKHPPVATGLTPERLATLLISANEGNILDYLTLAEEMEERDLHYGGVLSTRKNAVVKLGITIEAVSEDSRDQEIAAELRELFEQLSYRRFGSDLLDALGKGYSAVEIIWDTSGAKWFPSAFKWRDPRYFQFDIDTVSELRLRDLKDPVNGLELNPYKWVVHYPEIKTGIPIRGGLARLASFAHMAKSYSLKDWLAFSEVFGMPLRLGKYPMSATAEDQRALLTAVANIGTDAAAIIPEKMMIEFVSPNRSGTGAGIFSDLANYLDKQVSKGVLGQTMTTDDGSSLAQAKVHELVREDIIEADGQTLAESISNQFIEAWVVLNYGEMEKYPKARITIKKKEDLEAFSKSIGPMIDRGVQVDQAQIRDKFGLPEPEEGAVLMHPEGQGPTDGEPAAQRSVNRAISYAGAHRGGAPLADIDTSWDGGRQVAAAEVEDLQVMCAWVDAENADTKGAYKLPHHEAGGQHATIWHGVTAAMGALMGARGGVDIPASDRQGVYNHLARHYREFDREPPALQSMDHPNLLKALQQMAGADAVDELVELGLQDWQQQMDPMLQPIADLLEQSSNFDEFEAGLDKVIGKMDSDHFVKRLATTMFTGHGLGDATDKV